MKKIIGKFLRKILPSKIYKLVANGWIVVPKYYEALIDDAELYMNLSLEDSIKKDILLLRKYAHIIDKGLHREDAEPGHSNSIYIELKSLVDKLSQTDYADDPSYIWAKDRLHNYEILQNDCARFVHLRGDVPPIPPYSYDVLFEIIKQSLRNQSAKSKARREKARSALEPTVPIAKPVPEKPQLSEPFFKAEPEGSPGEMKGVIMDQAHERATPQGKLIHFDRLAADAPPMDRGRRKIADALDKAASPSKQPDSLAFARKKLEKESALKRAALEQCFGAKHFREFLEKNNQRVPPALAGLSFSTNE